MSIVTFENGIETLRARLHSTWTGGDYDLFSRFMEKDAHAFYERLDVPPLTQLLDVACGSGQLSLIAARNGVIVTGIDIAENLIKRAQARAEAHQLPARFEVADAQALPFANESFDVVVSLVGAMFAPRPERVARELMRVCVPGGTIAMVNWTAGGFIGQMFQTIARFTGPAIMTSPLLWGDAAMVRDRFGSWVSKLKLTRRFYTLDYPFPPHDVVDFFRHCYGPVNRAFASLDDTDQRRLREELVALWSTNNLVDGDFTVVEAEYLEVIATNGGGQWRAI
jgi:SAM-dependent methyltransferase